MSGFSEFHVSKKSRERYQLGKLSLPFGRQAAFSHFHAIRLFAGRMNETRDVARHPERTVSAGRLNTMVLIDEALHFILSLYIKERNAEALEGALEHLDRKLGKPSVKRTMRRFVELFPPSEIYDRGQSASEYLQGKTDEYLHTHLAVEEMLFLYLSNENPAFSPYVELFDDTHLKSDSDYLRLRGTVEEFLETQPPFGPYNQPIVELLRAPARAASGSLEGQLRYMKDHWGSLLSGDLMVRILLALDVMREEEKLRLLGPGPSLVPRFGPGADLYGEPERFSRDLDWMPQVVLVAKSVYVWLNQLSRKYGRSITRLDQIPDEELDTLARWGFTGLWLIGLWERSPASQKIKQYTGNPEALASAYAICDYEISGELGGEDGFRSLRDRAWQRGIRLASDMVPNHTGIDSKWVMEHPEWFIQLHYSPFPSYRFTGGDLSPDGRVGIFIEDGYWDRTDAAVVFKRVDRMSGDVRFIYHGNDGTSMPWNDTAQLNFLIKEVREAVIGNILHVARQFPIIRFDAAMTLTKRHYQRLWFPQPGTGGDIPSRSEHGMIRDAFDQLFPAEFWREVVDRVAQEVPETLLLAEAFWLMEGYFVRTLGMHRVYNSAFMNMLKMEENAKYRSVLRNVLEFNPEILRRFVNFMNNPDEATAVAQFGKGDKYFGVVLMMVTMPGLPMFGHGQIEGFTEKYGMEYRKAYWDEEVDRGLVERHEAEIFPLMRKRHLFSGVENFVLYDFHEGEGGVNENVFAFSNQSVQERALIVYNNKYENVRGWIRMSTPIAAAAEGGGDRKKVRKNLAEGLGVNTNPACFCVFRDQKSGLEYIRQARKLAEEGLYVALGAYQYHVFIDFKEIQDNREGHYAKLESYLNGKGVRSIEEALMAMLLAPIHDPFREIMNPLMLDRLVHIRRIGFEAPQTQETLQVLHENMEAFLREVKRRTHGVGDPSAIAYGPLELLKALVRLSRPDQLPLPHEYPQAGPAIFHMKNFAMTDTALTSTFWRVGLAWLLVRDMGRIASPRGYEQETAARLREWLLSQIIAQVFQSLGCDEVAAWRETDLIRILIGHGQWFPKKWERSVVGSNLKSLFLDPDGQRFLQFNWYHSTLWYNRERFEELMDWLFATSVVDILAAPGLEDEALMAGITKRYAVVDRIRRHAARSGYRVERMLNFLDQFELE